MVAYTETTMKYLGLILVLALVAGQVLSFTINENYDPLQYSLVQSALSDKFRDFLEKLKVTLREGNETLGIPQIDPYNNQDLNVTLEEEEVSGTARLRDLHVAGLADYTVDKADIAVFSRQITVGLTWPQIYAESLYKFNATVFNEFNAFGDGDFALTVNDLSFLSVVKFSVIGGVQITNMATKISLGALKLEITGFLNDKDASDRASEVISDIAPQLVQNYQEELTDAVNEIVMTIVNAQLEGKSLSDLIKIFG